MSTVSTLKDRHATWRESNPLRVARKHNSLSMMECATTLGVGMSSLQQWENGTQRPSPESMARIARFAGIAASTMDRRWRAWYGKRPTTT